MNDNPAPTAIGAEHVPALRRLGLRHAGDPVLQQRLAGSGLIDCRILADIDGARMIAVRARPRKHADGGIVVADVLTGESMLIAAAASSFVPIWILSGLIFEPISEWRNWRDLAESGWQEIARLHQALGGNDQLAPLREVLSTEAFCAALSSKPMDSRGVALFPAALNQCAPEDLRGAFQQAIEEIGREGWTTHEPDFPGPWGEPLTRILGLMASPPDPGQLPVLIERALALPAGQDASWAHLRGFRHFSGTATESTGMPLLLADAFARHAPGAKDDPWADAVREMARRGSAYDGRAHLNCITRLRDTGEAAAAWDAGMTACFWMSRQRQSLPMEMHLAMGRLAQDLFPGTLWPTVSVNLAAMGVEI